MNFLQGFTSEQNMLFIIFLELFLRAWLLPPPHPYCHPVLYHALQTPTTGTVQYSTVL